MVDAAPGRGEWVLHVDLDQFVAAVEVLRRPELAGRPVVVGGRGDPTERGVVATASYEARAHGVGSGMPLRVAARKLRDVPDAVFLALDKPVHEAASAEVVAVLRGLRWGGVPVLVEVLGWDEAFLAAGPDHGALGEPEELAAEVQRRLLERTRLHCSVGIGDTKVRAKTATGFAKPRGVHRLTAATWREVMGPRPTVELWGVGRRTAARLADLGLHTVADLMDADRDVLAAELGPTTGPWQRLLAHGGDTGPVDPAPHVARGHGREETFQVDLETPEEVEAAVRRLTAQALDDVVAEGRPVVRVGLKVRYRPFETVTRSRSLPAPTTDPAAVLAAAVGLLERTDRSRAVRLLGVRLEMADPTPPAGLSESPVSR
ncbi:DNA polymerase IV [Nocardioides perillae]|uniref:DNA polymerase-4 n=1 Tax=Nocardioides perillae TaxID=1119534 RepID=A0A7Y9RZC9_9ACTN|nr:DNA polymerase-4 [Nocardioides perillae]